MCLLGHLMPQSPNHGPQGFKTQKYPTCYNININNIFNIPKEGLKKLLLLFVNSFMAG